MPDPSDAQGAAAQTGCAFARHDHGRCREDALAHAAQTCAAQGLRLTPVRRRVLEILLESHRALGAYEVLERLAAEGLGAKPPVAYRALEFLTANGFAHRIEKLNAFVACAHPDGPEGRHTPAFLVCRACRTVAETAAPAAQPGLGAAADALGFEIETQVVEATGLCPACRAEEEA
ncbi:transcriptional repressor [Rhodovulum sp. DZ06]|uniref:transcriptional repressor n=1 Tax=Rhodovulum sp. DZ06 TaxID=3425126 RepID=UPI003D344689